MADVLDVYHRCGSLPFGRQLFSRLLCFKAPYFNSIRPRFESLAKGSCRIRMKKRRAVTNHIGSVHAIAMCNLAELAAGTTVAASLPRHMRWIPKGMRVSYDRIARSDLTASCELTPDRLDAEGECPVHVDVKDDEGRVVFRAEIFMYLSKKAA